MKSAIVACQEHGCSLVSWGSSDFLIEMRDVTQLGELKKRLTQLGFQHLQNEHDEQSGLFEFGVDQERAQASPFHDQLVIVAPLGVRVGPLFVAGFFLAICWWASTQSERSLRNPVLLIAFSSLIAVFSICSAVSASFWRVEFSNDSMSINSIFSKKTIAWDSIASVREAPSRTGRFLVTVVVKLHDGTELKSRNFHFHFAHQLRAAIQRRRELHCA